MKRTVAELAVEAALIATEVTTAGGHWSELPSNIPADVREELQDAIERAKDNAYDTVHENRNSFDPTQYDDFWETMAQDFLLALYHHNDFQTNLADWFDKVQDRLGKPGVLLKKIKLAPKEHRSALLKIYNDLLKKSVEDWRQAVQKNPDAHPEFDAWWMGSMSLEDASDAAKEWAHKLRLW